MGKNRQKANLTSNLLITTDIVNDRIGIGTTTPSTSLSVVGIVSATSFYGDGSNLSGISGGGGGADIFPSSSYNEAGNGGKGAVRIIWGTGRAFPDTLTDDQ